MNKTCGNCRYWKSEKECWQGRVEGFGTCSKAEMPENFPLPEKWLFCVIDGSDYFAALKTKESFGCVEFESKNALSERIGQGD